MMSRGASIVALLAACVAVTAYAQADPAVLTMWARPIVTFRATVAEIPPEQRVRNARERIDIHARALHAPPVTTGAVTIGAANGIAVKVGGNIVFGIVPDDLDPEAALTLEQAASSAAARLSAALEAREQQRRLPVLARGVGLTLLSLLGLIVAIRLILRVRELAIDWLDRLMRGRQMAIAGIDILPTLATVERATFRVLGWALIGACLYLWLTFALQLFPYTAPLGQRLGVYLTDRLAKAATAILVAMPNVVAVVAVLMVTRAVSLWVSRLLAEVEHGARVMPWLAQEQARATRRIVTGIIWLIGGATAYPLLPWSGSPVFQGMSVVLGLVVSLASTGLINQWISGLAVLYSRSFRVGDYVKMGQVEGYVTEIGALATKLRTARREAITIPNAVMITGELTNYTQLGRESGALLYISVCIGYDVPWQQVNELLLQAAAAARGVRTDPSPLVVQWELSDFYVQHQLHVRLENAGERAVVRAELNSRILDAFNAAGVQIMTPHFESQPDKRVVPPAARLTR